MPTPAAMAAPSEVVSPGDWCTRAVSPKTEASISGHSPLRAPPPVSIIERTGAPHSAMTSTQLLSANATPSYTARATCRRS